MVGKKDVGLPDEFYRHIRLRQHIEDGSVGHMPFAGGGKRAVESHLKALGVVVRREKEFGGVTGSHGVRRRRACAYAEYLLYGFHVC